MTMHWEIDQSPGEDLVVHLSGRITEEADFQTLTAIAQVDTLHLDLEHVEQINSCGVREWIHFVSDLTHGGHRFELVHCSPAIVRQLNMISNFRGGGAVRSVMLPYYCAECGHEEQRALDIPADGTLPPFQDVVVCSECGGSAEFDDMPDSYLAFAA